MVLAINGVDNVAKFLTLLLIFGFVLAATYFTTRFIANYQKGQSAHSNIKIIESARISQNKFIEIVKIGEKYYAIALGKDEIGVIAEVPENELDLESKNQELPGFNDILEKVKNKMPSKK